MRLSILLFAAACSGPGPVVVDLAPDPDRLGLDGLDGPHGVAHATYRAQARVTDVVEYEVAWPSTRSGDYAKDAERCPLAFLIHGGFVEADRYRWLITHWASRGYCVVSPAHDLELAIFESDNASVALDDLRDRPRGPIEGHLGKRAAILGHSLGAVVASFRWVADPRFEGVGILASFPADGTPIEEQRGRPSISLIGSEDREGEQTVRAYEEYQRFPEPAWFGVVDGMNHYDWADDPSDANLLNDGVAQRPRAETRRDAARVLDAWLDAWLRDDPQAATALELRLFPGISEVP